MDEQEKWPLLYAGMFVSNPGNPLGSGGLGGSEWLDGEVDYVDTQAPV